jgi:DNA-binding SARP family transcriptional activator
VSVDELIGELWGEYPHRTAVKTLGSYVSRLRRTLKEGTGATSELIASSESGYTLHSTGHEIDALRFEQLSVEGHRLLAAGRSDKAVPVLEAALALWRGTLIKT